MFAIIWLSIAVYTYNYSVIALGSAAGTAQSMAPIASSRADARGAVDGMDRSPFENGLNGPRW
jgi:hypothetical protein